MPFWIDTSGKLKLALTRPPLGEDWLESVVGELKREGVDTLVSLLTAEESAELGLEGEEAACAAAGLKFRNFPIPDRTVPESTEDFLSFARSVYSEAASGAAIAAHCRGCIGRSSVLLATIMRLHGFSAEEAFERISRARGMSVPDTEEQARWVAGLRI